MNTMNVIIADDHPIVLFGIRKSLEQIEWVNVVGEFEDSTALINNLPKLDAHVLITDLSMPGDKYGDGITLIKPKFHVCFLLASKITISRRI
ncbi:Transcriptional regulatory protein RcsB [Klebsiella pneumoniae]|nr:Transcriptional regulatory protein RcsB [Klebsiella pneumoniae]CAH6023557.1 Transcriptional regulatory protein RcsB [Klebsiella pneumoniae]